MGHFLIGFSRWQQRKRGFKLRLFSELQLTYSTILYKHKSKFLLPQSGTVECVQSNHSGLLRADDKNKCKGKRLKYCGTFTTAAAVTSVLKVTLLRNHSIVN